jgi:mannosyl-oligosaccharide glucosidase
MKRQRFKQNAPPAPAAKKGLNKPNKKDEVKLHILEDPRLTLALFFFICAGIYFVFGSSPFRMIGYWAGISDPHLPRFAAEVQGLPALSPDWPNFSAAHKSSLLWGTWRPAAYCGVRTRVGEDALIGGLMWGVPIYQQYHLRHLAKSEENVGYKWHMHNGRDFGLQALNDTKGDVFINTTWIKFNTDNKYGGDWALRINVERKSSRAPVDLYYYFGLEHAVAGEISPSMLPSVTQNYFSLTGFTPSTNDFLLSVFDNSKKSSTNYAGVSIPEVWTIENKIPLYFDEREGIKLRTGATHDSNTFVVQKTAVAPFSIDIVFTSDVTNRFKDEEGAKQFQEKLIVELPKSIEQRTAEFDEKFNKVFPLKVNATESHAKFAKVALSNLLGGIGYFHGRNRIYKPIANEGEQSWYFSEPKELFTGTPSRAYFPRGFWWDEGFHQLIVSKWDDELSRDMISSWLGVMEKNGWIPREQILGSEAESRVPAEFIVQYPTHANPPAMFMTIDNMFEAKKGKLTKEDREWFKGVLTKLAHHFQWFMNSQHGVKTNTFGWQGSKGNHTLASGLDDYPRFAVRSEFEEHVDLATWLVVASKTLDKLSRVLVPEKGIESYHVIQHALERNIQRRYWDSQINAYCDFDGQKGQFSEHLGYVSLFPFFFELLESESPRLQHIYKLMSDPDLMYSKYGLRSLSKSDSWYGTDENYWRSPIWININYLALKALHQYGSVWGPHSAQFKELYKDLRHNIIHNMYRVYNRQGAVFENYSPDNGRGKGQAPFAGWSSLVVLIMSEQY